MLLRTAAWRYTEWLRWNGTSLLPEWGQSVGTELYAHTGDKGDSFDAFENVNQVKGNQQVAARLRAELMAIVAAQKRTPRL